MNTIDTLKLALEALENTKEVFAKIQEHGIRLGASAKQVRLGEVLIYDRAIAALEQAIKQEEQQPVPVKTYSGGKAWPVQVDKCRRELQKSGQYLCDCLEGKCPDAKG